jgi:hypothetical protein
MSFTLWWLNPGESSYPTVAELVRVRVIGQNEAVVTNSHEFGYGSVV